MADELRFFQPLGQGVGELGAYDVPELGGADDFLEQHPALHIVRGDNTTIRSGIVIRPFASELVREMAEILVFQVSAEFVSFFDQKLNHSLLHGLPPSRALCQEIITRLGPPKKQIFRFGCDVCATPSAPSGLEQP